jgi:hypothetical protein
MINPNTKSIPLETGRSVKGKQKVRFAKQITKTGWQAVEKPKKRPAFAGLLML